MPFLKYIKKIKKDCVSLQVQRSKKIKVMNCFFVKKRACLLTSKGSVTLEGAIVSAIFIFVMLFMISFLNHLNVQIMTQNYLNNLAIVRAKTAFYMEQAKKITKIGEELEKVETTISKVETGLKQISCAFYGLSGVDISESNCENGFVDMVINYQIKVPYIGQSLKIKQRAYVKDWTGTDIAQTQTKVFVTETGKVYHCSKNCSHLVIKISKCEYERVLQKRNDSGEQYTRCLNCIRDRLQNHSTVFITEDGNKYHSSLMCSGLKRTIIEINIDEIKNLKPCSGCVGSNK